MILCSLLLATSLHAASFAGAAEHTAASIPSAAENSAAAKSSASQKPRARTLQEIVDLAMARGKDQVIPKSVAEPLGFNGAVHAKLIWHDELKSKTTGEGHGLYVVCETVQPNGTRPVALIWAPTEIQFKEKEEKYYEGWRFRTDFVGAMQFATHNSGYSGHVLQNPVPISSSKAKKLLKKETNYFSKIALSDLNK